MMHEMTPERCAGQWFGLAGGLRCRFDPIGTDEGVVASGRDDLRPGHDVHLLKAHLAKSTGVSADLRPKRNGAGLAPAGTMPIRGICLRSSGIFISCGILILSFAPRSASAQQPAVTPPLPTTPPAITESAAAPDETPPETGKVGDRIFGVLPNYTTVEGAKTIQPPTVKQRFRMAEQNSFDPFVFPFVGVVAGFGAGQSGVGYPRRYGMALADNTIGNFLTTAVLPSALGQDPRYFELGTGSVWHRAGYALSRSVVTRGASGASQFNLSEIGGNALAAGVSNLYYPAADRTLTSTLTRWGTQLMWDAVSNELKEFWPDIRGKIRKKS
jgi:hypothetical protein